MFFRQHIGKYETQVGFQTFLSAEFCAFSCVPIARNPRGIRASGGQSTPLFASLQNQTKARLLDMHDSLPCRQSTPCHVSTVTPSHGCIGSHSKSGRVGSHSESLPCQQSLGGLAGSHCTALPRTSESPGPAASGPPEHVPEARAGCGGGRPGRVLVKYMVLVKCMALVKCMVLVKYMALVKCMVLVRAGCGGGRPGRVRDSPGWIPT
jgi:hypothetical protein